MNIRPLMRCAVVAALVFTVAACASDPEALLPVALVQPPADVPSLPAPEPIPEPEPEPPPPPEPVGHAPLVGTRWTLVRLYGDMRRLEPTSRDVWIEFRREAAVAAALSDLTGGTGPMVVQGPQNPIGGTYRFRVHTDSPRESLTFEEGQVSGNSIVRDRRAGSYSEFEDMLLDNLGILKGYYIEGETPEESTLTIWGGYRSEEVILMELEASIPATGM